MDDLTIGDLIMMLVVHRRPRDHSTNLELVRTLFERDIGRYNLHFNLIIAIAVGILTLIAGWAFEAPRAFDIIFLIPVVLGVTSMVGVILWARSIGRKRTQIRQRYLQLIRLYYLLDRVI